jgi:hypothetical protein
MSTGRRSGNTGTRCEALNWKKPRISRMTRMKKLRIRVIPVIRGESPLRFMGRLHDMKSRVAAMNLVGRRCPGAGPRAARPYHPHGSWVGFLDEEGKREG